MVWTRDLLMRKRIVSAEKALEPGLGHQPREVIYCGPEAIGASDWPAVRETAGHKGVVGTANELSAKIRLDDTEAAQALAEARAACK